MGLDIRWPIGLMFTLIGALLTGYGAYTGSDPDMYKRSLGINIDLIWGLVLLLFGLIMLLLAWLGKNKAAQDNPANKL
jgi:multisubunit Na+/H+ antiporter MnhG subunit